MSLESPGINAAHQTTARDFVAIMFRRRGIILGLFAVTTLTVLIIGLSSPVEFVSMGRVLVKRGEKESALSPERHIYSDWEEDMGSEVEVVKSSPVLERARALLRDEAGPGRAAPAIDGDAVDVEIKGRTNVILIGYLDRDPIVAKLACDALLRAYVEFRQNNFSMQGSRTFFEGELEKVQKDLDHWVALRRDYAQRTSVVDLPTQRTTAINSMAGLRQMRTENEADLAEATSTWKKLAAMSDENHLDQPFGSTFTDQTALIEIKRHMLDQEVRVASLRETMRDDAPEVVAATATLDTLKVMLHQEMSSRVEAAHARVSMLQARHDALEGEITTLQARIDLMPSQEYSLGEMDHRIDQLKSRLHDLTEGSEKARITQSTSPTESVVLLEHASDATPRNQRDYVRLALGPAFSLVVGIGLAFFIDGLDLTVRTASHAEEAVDLPVLATLVERRRSRRRGTSLEPERAAS